MKLKWDLTDLAQREREREGVRDAWSGIVIVYLLWSKVVTGFIVALLLLVFICGLDPNDRRSEKSGREPKDLLLLLRLRLDFLQLNECLVGRFLSVAFSKATSKQASSNK